MPSWGEILKEIQQSHIPETGVVDFDLIRHKHLAQLSALTGRHTVIYASDWIGGGGPASSIRLHDMQGLMEVFKISLFETGSDLA